MPFYHTWFCFANENGRFEVLCKGSISHCKQPAPAPAPKAAVAPPVEVPKVETPAETPVVATVEPQSPVVKPEAPAGQLINWETQRQLFTQFLFWSIFFSLNVTQHSKQNTLFYFFFLKYLFLWVVEIKGLAPAEAAKPTLVRPVMKPEAPASRMSL